MTPKQRLFVNEYRVDLDVPAAAARVGVSAAVARRWMKKDEVRAALDAVEQSRNDSAIMRAEEVLRELTAMARTDLLDFYEETGELKPLSKMPPAARRVIASLEHETHYIGTDEIGLPMTAKVLKLKRWSKEKALELLGKHYKLFTDKVELESNAPTAVTFIVNGVKR
jgi:phage terminase small subunit